MCGEVRRGGRRPGSALGGVRRCPLRVARRHRWARLPARKTRTGRDARGFGGRGRALVQTLVVRSLKVTGCLASSASTSCGSSERTSSPVPGGSAACRCRDGGGAATSAGPAAAAAVPPLEAITAATTVATVRRTIASAVSWLPLPVLSGLGCDFRLPRLPLERTSSGGSRVSYWTCGRPSTADAQSTGGDAIPRL